VRTPDQAAAIARVADGVVVGSALVDVIAAHGTSAAAPLQAYTRSLADAIHAARKEAIA
jgi:tryptophan synthase alpha chain